MPPLNAGGFAISRLPDKIPAKMTDSLSAAIKTKNVLVQDVFHTVYAISNADQADRRRIADNIKDIITRFCLLFALLGLSHFQHYLLRRQAFLGFMGL